MTKLRSLKINKYRSVRPGTFLEFSGGQNVILGPNGSGKTTLLELIRSILGFLVPTEEIDVECHFDGHLGSLRAHLVSKRPSKDGPELTSIEEVDRERLVRAGRLPSFTVQSDIDIAFTSGSAIKVRADGDEAYFELNNERHSLKAWNPTVFSVLNPLIGVAVELSDKAVLQELFLLANTLLSFDSCRLDEGLDSFEWMLETAAIQLNEAGTYCFRGNWMKDQDEHRLLDGKAKSSQEFEFEHYPELAAACRLMGFHSGRVKFDLQRAGSTSEQKAEYGNVSFQFVKPDGSTVRHDRLSYGQKRLLAFSWYLFASPSFAVVDELANGLHYSWIRECMGALGDRQSFLTSQNPLLLDALDLEAIEKVKETFVLCQAKIVDGREMLVWRSLTDDEVEEFWNALGLGIQNINEILRAKGLW